MHGDVPFGSNNSREFLGQLSDSHHVTGCTSEMPVEISTGKLDSSYLRPCSELVHSYAL
jgi:hypothetical protein